MQTETDRTPMFKPSLADLSCLGSCLGAAATTVLAGAVLLAPSPAQACGGTFCDSGPNAMPVDQTGENVVFVLDDDQVEAHIQIQYDPDADAESFAWVIPVMAVPTFEAGSQQLFSNLLNGSVPTYGYNNQSDSCMAPGGDEGGTNGSGTGLTGGDDGAGDGDGDEDPDVVFQDTVGAFEISVLEGGTIEGVMDWLGDNGYQQDPNAEPILGEYLEEGFLFVAMKLQAGAGTDEIHPIVIRYEGSEPCVPLRLTRIAAEDDMDVRVFFLGEERTVPVNYRHVLVNPLMIDWINFADNYKDVITMAVDADSADGNAFVTEFAGSSAQISQSGLFSPAWDEAPAAALDASPVGLAELLRDQGQLDCESGTCDWMHPLIEGLLKQFVPVPGGVDEAEFYSCLECYEPEIDLEAWDAAEFATQYRERIIGPGEHALALLQQNPYLTRMYTTISPNEMTVDPIFRENPNLDPVPDQRIGTLTTHCNGAATMELPDGREVYLPDPTVWPTFQEEMPWEEKIDLAVETGPLMNLVDNTDQINALLADYNGSLRTGGGCGCDVSRGGAGTVVGFGLFCLAGISLRRRRH